MLLDLLRWLHVIGAAVILAAAIGLPYMLLGAARDGTPAAVLHVMSAAKRLMGLVNAFALLLQPLTGFMLALKVGWPIASGWLGASLVLYGLALVVWWLMLDRASRLQACAAEAVRAGRALTQADLRLMRSLAILTVAATLNLLGLLWLMVAKPVLPLP